MIILEGIDGSGKTSLLNELKQTLGVDVAPRFVASSVEGPKPDLGRLVRADLNGWPRSSVKLYDRYPMISDYIYGPVIRGQVDPTLEAVEAAYFSYFRANALIIMCRPPLETVKENLKNNEHMAGVVEHIDELYRQYRDMEVLLLETGCEVVPYDYTQDMSHVVTLARTHVENWRNQ